MKTYVAKPSEVTRQWYLIDADGKTLGHLANEVSVMLRGKNKPEFTPHVDCGDFVVVINAEKIKVSGKKEVQKKYYSHSGFPGGFKEETLAAVRRRKPELIIERAVKGMLPHTTLGREQFTKLKVYVGDKHPHEAQKPQTYTLSR
ncbi:MAG: 50S ribosomal protein L13 [Cyanobacteria bacterium TGS_CYA1]|nr:50S ribosomal protein L13 [Cyanobacteria bacterium TGS_CYA1]MDX2106649.1 50S ribosomal protein L13 [Candidatus Melainabacteria bacterium]